MNAVPTNPNSDRSQTDTDSLDCVLVEVTTGVEDTTVRPTTETIRNYLAGKPWLLQKALPPVNPAPPKKDSAALEG